MVMASQSSSSPTTKDQFDRLAGFASSFSMGAVAGFIASIKQINPTLEFQLSLLTILSFIGCFGVTWWVHNVIFDEKTDSMDPRRRKKTILFFGVTSMLAVMSCMGFALKGISQNKLKDVSFGVVIAALFISIAAFFFFKVVGFLHKDERNNSLDRDS